MPKTFKNLYPKIYDFENLHQAHRQARKGGKRKRPEVAEFEHNLVGSVDLLRKPGQGKCRKFYSPHPVASATPLSQDWERGWG